MFSRLRRSARRVCRLQVRATVVVAVAMVLLALTGVQLLVSRGAAAPPPLLSEGAGIGPDGATRALRPGSTARFVANSRVLDSPGDPHGQERAAVQIAWLEAGTIPGDGGEFAQLARSSLLDMLVLTQPNGAVLAGPTGAWAHCWPRDASFVAAAFAATGHLDDAERVLGFLQSVQRPDGVFEARYQVDGAPVADGRAPQLDGSGWALWALGSLADATPPPERAALLTRFDPLLQRSTAAITSSLDSTGLPPPSSDYWERPESALTLGTAAPLAAGLRAAEKYGAVSAGSALRIDSAIDRAFGPTGYGRYEGQAAPDAAVAFLVPPIGPAPAGSDRIAALQHAQSQLARPGGGLSPGTAWRETTISWTPETALVALAQAGVGNRGQSDQLLRWLRDHRTDAGAVPEKVLADGAPASVAPLAWSDALVILTLAQ